MCPADAEIRVADVIAGTGPLSVVRGGDLGGAEFGPDDAAATVVAAVIRTHSLRRVGLTAMGIGANMERQAPR